VVQVIVETARLVIRPWTHDAADLARLTDLYSRPEVTWFIGPLRAPSRETVDRWRERMRADHRQIVSAMEVRATGVIAGTVLYKPLPGEHHMEVGWHLHPDSWGNGYATEAGRAAVERGFRLGVPEVFAVVRPDNPRSQAVCKRLGMRHLGRTGRYYDMDLELFHLAGPSRKDAQRPGVGDAAYDRRSTGRRGATGSAIDL
jgi:RimJ/RimL family protein N-acetyltransferase